MSAETFTTAMFLITAVIAAGVLINAVFPVVYTMAGTFQSATHESDQRLRTDFKIVTTVGNSSQSVVHVWMKNIGGQRIALADIQKSDVFCGEVGNFGRLTYKDDLRENLVNGQWTEIFDSGSGDLNNNAFWDPGETLEVYAKPSVMPGSGGLVYFQFVLPSGIWRSNEFTAS
ncbi:MAG: flagellin [Methanoregula sp.]|nr:flagellin [Methanoregula sp.]